MVCLFFILYLARISLTMRFCFSQATSLILQNDQAAINGIRSTGAAQLILAPGNGFTGGHSWTQVTGENDDPSSEWLNMLSDPLGNTAIDIHEYLG